MTIEAKLDRTNELLEELLAKFSHIGQATGPAPKNGTEVREQRAEQEQKAPPAPVTATEHQKAAPAGTLSYDKDIKGWALAIAKKDRAKLTGPEGVWTKLGVKVGTELKPEQWAEAERLIRAVCQEMGITAPIATEPKK